MRSKTQGRPRGRLPIEPVNGAQQRTYVHWLYNGGAVGHPVRRQCAPQSGRWIAFGTPGGNRETEHHAASAAQPLGGLVDAASFDLAEQGEQFLGGDLA